ncbi:unnamed protein product [Phytomonas sp. Hart1]|nr:unnamed protein product [Phytomonas sp. Hart1]|eukprot:CCW66922.1 unnamed protein product [Phytomonas sp. isolate Hart1]
MSLRLKQNSLRACREKLATDLVNAYTNFISAFPDLTIATIENFAPLFEKSYLEYLFYSGNCTLDCPYHEWVVEEVLQLSVAYLYLPVVIVNPHARRFGFLLVFYFYFTQPAMSNKYGVRPMPVRVASHIINDVLDRKYSSNSNSDGCLVDTFYGYDAVDDNEERRIVLAMYKHQAWCLTLYDNIGDHLQALIDAHEKSGALLLSQRHEESSPKVRIPTLPSKLASRHLPTWPPASTGRIQFNSPKKNALIESSQTNLSSFSSSMYTTQNESNSVFPPALSKEIEHYETLKRSIGFDSIF